MRYLEINEAKQVIGNYVCPQLEKTLHPVDESKFEGLLEPYKYDPSSKKLTSDVSVVSERLEKEVIEEHAKRAAAIIVTVPKGTFLASQASDIISLISLIDNESIDDGSAKLSTSDRRSRPELTRAELAQIGVLIAIERDSLAEKRLAKLESLDACTQITIQSFDPSSGW